jgi:uncharacterized delta-60 repeat protein
MDRRRLDGFGSPRIALLLVCLGFGLILGVSSLSASSGRADTVRSQDGVGALGVEPDGTLVAAGSSRLGGPSHRRFALARYTAAGKLDRRFGTGGKVLTGFGLRFVRPRFPSNAGVASLAIQRDGKIVVAGYAYRPPGLRYSAFALARYTVSGKLDRTFGRKGTVLTSFGSRTNSTAAAVAIAPDGKIVAVGSGFALARYRPGGRLDPSFGRGGKLVTGFGAHSFYGTAEAVAIQPDGKVVVAGEVVPRGPRTTKLAVVRYNSDGSLDRSFGTGGRVVTQVGEFDSYGAAIVVQPDGKIVVAGRAAVGLRGVAALVRYSADGALDPGFGRGGIVLTNTAGFGPLALVIQRDRKLVTALDPFGVARFLEGGSLDGTFGRDGKVRTNFHAKAIGNEVVVQPDGKIVVAGSVGSSYPQGDFALARYTSSGRLDGSFGRAGKVHTDFGSLWRMRGR